MFWNRRTSGKGRSSASRTTQTRSQRKERRLYRAASYGLENLEGRMMLSTANPLDLRLAPALSGAAAVDDGASYALALSPYGSVPQGAGALPTVWSIDWGDGSSLSGVQIVHVASAAAPPTIHYIYAEPSTYTIEATVTDVDNQSTTVGATVEVDAADLAIAQLGICANAGESYCGAVATFTAAQPNDSFTAQIIWGDDQYNPEDASITPITGTNQFLVCTAGHSISSIASEYYSVTITGTDASTSSQYELVSDPAPVVPLLAAGNIHFRADPGQSLSGVVVGSFVDVAGAGSSVYTATIDWGDGTSSGGQATPVGIGYDGIFGDFPFVQYGNGPWRIVDLGQGQVSVIDASYNTHAGSISGDTISVPDLSISGQFNDECTQITWTNGDVWSRPSGTRYNIVGSHAYSANPGDYIASVTVSHGDFGATTVSGDVSLHDFDLTLTPADYTVTEGQSCGSVVAMLSDADLDEPGDVSVVGGHLGATIDWGDGSPSEGAIITRDPANGSDFTISGAGDHAYTTPGVYAYTVTATDSGGASAISSGSTTVLGAGFSVTPPSDWSGVVGDTFDGAVLSFADNNSLAPEAHGYTATIDWGDGHTDTGVSPSLSSGGNWEVDGSHTYTAWGVYQVTVTVQETGGDSTTGGFQSMVSGTGAELSAIANGASEADLTWQAASGVGGYTYFVNRTTDDPSMITSPTYVQAGSTMDTDFADQGLAPNMRYWYQVVAGVGSALITCGYIQTEVQTLTGSSDTAIGVTSDATNPVVLMATTNNLSNSAQISVDWGDGSTSSLDDTTGDLTRQLDWTNHVATITATHVYTAGGWYPATMTLSDQPSNDGMEGASISQAYWSVSVIDTPITFTQLGFTARPGQSYTGQVAAFTTTYPNDSYSAIITWNDDQTMESVFPTPVEGHADQFQVSSTGHILAGVGLDVYSVTIYDNTLGFHFTSAAAPVCPLVTDGTRHIEVAEGQTNSSIVGSFVDMVPGDATVYGANIDWGDQTTTSADAVSIAGSGYTSPIGDFPFVQTTNNLYGPWRIVDQGQGQVSVIDASNNAYAASISEGTISVPELDISGSINAECTTITWSNGDVWSRPSGTRFDVYGSHAYTSAGNFDLSITVSRGGMGDDIFPATASVDDGELNITPGGFTITEGHPYTGPLATFTDADPMEIGDTGNGGHLSASVDWGDGNGPQPATITGNAIDGFTISNVDGYTRPIPGDFEYIVTVSDSEGQSATATGTASFAAEATFTQMGICANVGEYYSGPVAIFSVRDPGDSFNATIHWSNDNSDEDVIPDWIGDNLFQVTTAGHTIGYDRSDAYTVTVTDESTGASDISDPAPVCPLIATDNLQISPTQGQNFSTVVGSFLDLTRDTNSPFTATIYWGDGTSSDADSVSSVGGGYTGPFGDYVQYGGQGLEHLWHVVHQDSSQVLLIDDSGASCAATLGDHTITAAASDWSNGNGACNGDYSRIAWDNGAVWTRPSGIRYEVTGSHTYTDVGDFSITISVSHGSLGAASLPATASVADAPLAVTSEARDLNATEGDTITPSDLVLFSDADPQEPGDAQTAMDGHLSAFIDWGDGSGHGGATISGDASSGFTVSASEGHAYVVPGIYGYIVHIIDSEGVSTTSSGSATIAGAGLSVTPISTWHGTAGDVFSGPVATLIDNNTLAGQLQYNATVYWGDGASDSGVSITPLGDGVFEIDASHYYTAWGIYSVHVHVDELTWPDGVPGDQGDADWKAAVNGSGQEISALILSATDVDVSWQPASGADLTYSIYHHNAANDNGSNPDDIEDSQFQIIATTGDTCCSDHNLFPNAPYLYRITASDGDIRVTSDPVYAQSLSITALQDSVVVTEGDVSNPVTLTATTNDLSENATISVVWGDGTASQLGDGSITREIDWGNHFATITATHVFVTVPTAAPTIAITEGDGDTSVSASDSWNDLEVDDAPMSITVLSDLSVGEHTSIDGLLLATFTDGNPLALANYRDGNYTATITWQNDSETATITPNTDAGYFEVRCGSRTFGVWGSADFTIDITDNNGGETASADGSITITDAPLTLSGDALVFSDLNTLTIAGGTTLGIFSDTDTDPLDGDTIDSSQHYTVSINWGDRGSDNPDITSGTVSGNADGTWNVYDRNDHTYYGLGTYTITATITDNYGGQSLVATAIANVDAPLTLVAEAQEITTFERSYISTDALITFRDDDPAELGDVRNGGHLSATIDWGDYVNTQAGATITGNAADGFTVSGISRQFFSAARDLPYTYIVSVTDAQGATLVSSSKVHVALDTTPAAIVIAPDDSGTSLVATEVNRYGESIGPTDMPSFIYSSDDAGSAMAKAMVQLGGEIVLPMLAGSPESGTASRAVYANVTVLSDATTPDGQIYLRWFNYGDTPSGYRICIDDGTSVAEVTVDGSVCTYEVHNPAAATTYRFAVVPVYPDEANVQSNVVQITTPPANAGYLLLETLSADAGYDPSMLQVNAYLSQTTLSSSYHYKVVVEGTLVENPNPDGDEGVIADADYFWLSGHPGDWWDYDPQDGYGGDRTPYRRNGTGAYDEGLGVYDMGNVFSAVSRGGPYDHVLINSPYYDPKSVYWGPFNSDHEYAIYLAGTDSQAWFRFNSFNPTDNSGSLTVKIYAEVDGAGYTISAVEGQPTTYAPVATFSGAFSSNDATGCTATIDWGDGTSDSPDITCVSPTDITASDGQITVYGSHAYLEEPDGASTYPLSVVLTRGVDDIATASGTASVSDPAPVITWASPLSISVGQPAPLTVHFTDSGPLDTHVATVDWGDGHISTISASTSGGDTLVEPSGSSPGTIVASHIYTDDWHGAWPSVTIADADPGGPSVTQYIETAAANATVSGFVWNDLNRNGGWDKAVHLGTNPNIIVAIHTDDYCHKEPLPGEIVTPPPGNCDADDDHFGAEVQALQALNQRLIDLGLGNTANVSVICWTDDDDLRHWPFTGPFTRIKGMNPASGLFQVSTHPVMDADNNGVLDVMEDINRVELNSQDYLMDYDDRGDTSLLKVATRVFGEMGAAPGNATLIVLSDGDMSDEWNDADYAQQLQTLRAEFAPQILGFQTGIAGQLINGLDPTAGTYTTVPALEAAVASAIIGPLDLPAEPALAGRTVYGDLNNDGQLV